MRVSDPPQQGTVIGTYAELQALPGLEAGLDAVFFAASNVTSFESGKARAEFRERWLGRYLAHDPHLALVALSPDDEVLGYVVGAIDDPALTARFSDIAYFATFKELTARYPAHLHVNLAPKARNAGLGSLLVNGFISKAAKAGARGVHVVTSRDARNVTFYNRNGFHESGSLSQGGRDIVFLARSTEA
jgi:GNAT superfamily N-acetyltransferase